MTGRIPREFIDEVVARTDIVELIDGFVPLKKQGKNFVACCPFHNEKTPSFSVSPQKQIYHCFGCGVSGNVISFLMDYNHQTFPEAIESLAADVGLEVPRSAEYQPQNKPDADLYQITEQAAAFYQQQLRQHPQAERAITYLQKRGLSGQICKRFGIGFAPPGWDNLSQSYKPAQQKQLLATGMLISKDNGGSYDRFRDRIMFPIRDRRGRVIAFGGRVLGDDTPKYLNSPETPIFHKGQELYGLFEALESNRSPEFFIIVEGYMDVVALAQHDINNAVATLGTATSKTHLQQLLRHSKNIIFCFDGDTAGHEAAWRALETSLSMLQDGVHIRFMFLPQGEDPDSLVRREGRDTFLQRAKQAKSLADVLLARLSRDTDLNSLEGKSRLIKRASPLVEQVPEGAFKLMLIEQIGRKVRIEADRIRKMLQGKPMLTTAKQQLHRQEPLQLSPQVKVILALLLQNPEIWSTLDAEFQRYPLNQLEKGANLLQSVFDLVAKNPKITAGQLLEHWRESHYFNTINQLAHWQHPIPETGIKAEVVSALHRMRINQQSKQVEHLLEKAKNVGLSDEERSLLQQLIRASKTQPTEQ